MMTTTLDAALRIGALGMAGVFGFMVIFYAAIRLIEQEGVRVLSTGGIFSLIGSFLGLKLETVSRVLSQRQAASAEDDARFLARLNRDLRAVVHDPTARRMGGVAGHAGLFATPADLARLARCVLQGGAPVLKRESVDALRAALPNTRIEWP